METTYVPEMPEEDKLLKFFPGLKENLHLVHSNRYFGIERK